MSNPVRYAIREAIYLDQYLVVKIGGEMPQTRNPCSLSRDPRPPWVAKLAIGLFIAYALSPIDLIPDFIPVLGYLGDLLLWPLGISVALKLIPAAFLVDARRAAQQSNASLAKSRGAAIVIVVLWTIAAMIVSAWALRYFAAK